MTIAALNSPKDYTIYYHNSKELGFSVFILQNPEDEGRTKEQLKSRKKHAVLWDLYPIMRPSKIQIEEAAYAILSHIDTCRKSSFDRKTAMECSISAANSKNRIRDQIKCIFIALSTNSLFGVKGKSVYSPDIIVYYPVIQSYVLTYSLI